MINQIPQSEAIRIARELFSEAYAGPKPQWSWFVNAEPDSGLFGSMKGLTAEQATAEPSPGGRSIAAHVEHLRWSLETVNRTLRGEPWEKEQDVKELRSTLAELSTGIADEVARIRERI